MLKTVEYLDFTQGSLTVRLVLERTNLFYGHSLSQPIVVVGGRTKQKKQNEALRYPDAAKSS